MPVRHSLLENVAGVVSGDAPLFSTSVLSGPHLWNRFNQGLGVWTLSGRVADQDAA